MTSLDDNVCEFQYNQCMKPSRDSLGKIAWVRKDFLSQGKISDILIWCARKKYIRPLTQPFLSNSNYQFYAITTILPKSHDSNHFDKNL